MSNPTQINPFSLVGKTLKIDGEEKKVTKISGKMFSETSEITFRDGSRMDEEELLEKYEDQVEEAMTA